nr:hypothetical protein [Tanacetum cinerariifolium]
MIISLRRGINPRNPQHVIKNCETCGSNVHTTSDHNNIKWFRKRETLQAKNAESFKASKNDSSSALRSKTLTKRGKHFRNAIGAHYLPHSNEYVAPPSIDVVRQWFLTIRYAKEEDIIIKLKKKQRAKVVPYTRFLSLLIMHKMKEGYEDDEVTLYPTQLFSFNNWALKPNQPKEPPFTDHMLAICAADKPVVFKAPKTYSKAESVSQKATKGGSSKAPNGSKTGHSKKRKESSSAIDLNPSQPPVSTPVDTGMHKEDQQTTGGPTSLGLTSEERANPQLSSDQTKYVCERLETILTQPITRKGASSIASQIEVETSITVKLEYITKLVSHVQPSFKDLDSLEDDPVIVVNDSDEDEDDEVHATKNVEIKDTSAQKNKLELKKNRVEAEAALLKAQPFFPTVEQLKEILVKSLKTEFLNIPSAYDFNSSLPTELKDLPSKFNDQTKEVKRLKNQVHNLEIELPIDLKEILPKLEDFTKSVTGLTSQVAELKTLQWNCQLNFLLCHNKLICPLKGSSQIKGEQIKKDKGKKALSLEEALKESIKSDFDDDETHLSGSMVKCSRIKKVKKFDFVTEDGKHIHLTEEQINQQKKMEEEAKAEAAKHKSKVRKEELIDLC